MKKLLNWIDRKRIQYGQIIVLLAALALFTALAFILALVYAVFIALLYIDPNLIYVLTVFLLMAIVPWKKL